MLTFYGIYVPYMYHNVLYSSRMCLTYVLKTFQTKIMKNEEIV